MAGILVAGTTSDAGKSVVTAGICRWLWRRGVKVAPFKAQNMSNNSAVVVDGQGRGGEIGRAQALQAFAAGVEPQVRFNPVLLKPGSDHTSQVVLLGRAVGSIDAVDFHELKRTMSAAAFAAYDELQREFDVVVCEGAGSPTEINLRANDYVNMGLARHGGLPVIVVGDIDRGGVFASLFGTVALLERADQSLVSGFLINKFRGSRELLQPGLDTLGRLTGRPTLGVLPFDPDLWIDGEDALAYGRVLGRPEAPRGSEWLRVAVVRLPRISNATDAEALASEPGVAVRLVAEVGELGDADLIVLPGSKSTVDDLEWLRRTGLADAVLAHAKAGKPVLGICGGFQMLARRVVDEVESRRGEVDGLGLLAVEIGFRPEKTLARPAGHALGAPVAGYEIHHGQVLWRDPELPGLITLPSGEAEGAATANLFGTHWHGAFESNEFRRRFLALAARIAGRRGFEVAPATDFGALRTATVDRLADLIEEHADTEALWRLIEAGPPAGLPFIGPGDGRD
jgi:adenosylcobyric acid synthase